MCAAVSSVRVAMQFIDIADGSDPHLSKLKLMKLVYIAQGWFLAIYDKPLINEKIYAWRHGPVFPDLFSRMKKYKDKEVVKNISLNVIERMKTEKIGKKGIRIIKDVSKQYEENTGGELCGMTHMLNTPWDFTCKKHGSYLANPVIEQYVIRDYYIKILELNKTAHD